ncbi:MAG: CBS domain-containing protein [Myxococcota bacterium]
MGLCTRDIMRTGVRSVRPELGLPELEEEFVKERVTGFPVIEGDRLVGVISRSDLVRRLVTERTLEDYASTYYVDLSGFDDSPPLESLGELAARTGARIETLTVGDMMTRAAITVSPDTPLADLAALMRDRRVHRVPVTEEGRLVGIVSALDFVGLVAEGRLVTP